MLRKNYLRHMFADWLRFDIRFFQFLSIWNLPKIIRIYGWWTIIFWPFEWMLGLLHLIGFSHVAQPLLKNRSTRRLNEREINIAKSIFGDRLKYDLVSMNGSSRIARRLRIAFVTGNQINFNDKMSEPLLIHELTHIYQYQQVGLVYIPRCLKAQYSREGYNFGEVVDHLDILNGSTGLGKLNYEQQAEFLETLYAQRATYTLASGLSGTFHNLNFTV